MNAERLDVDVVADAECVMRDGTVLRADIYQPQGRGPFPVLLCRTPYDKSAPLNAIIARELATRGYIAVTQDIRGSHCSDGNLVWHFKREALDVEARDGYDSVEWVATQPGSDGRVGTFGVSYSSWLSLCLMKSCPPSLKAMSISGMVGSIHDMNFGIFETGRRLQWTYSQAAGLRARSGDTRWPASLAEANADWLGNMRGKWIWRTPLEAIPDEIFGELSADLTAYYREQAQELWPFANYYRNVGIPVCIQTGWWDRFSMSVSHLEALARDGKPEVANQHRLVIGPWPHSPFNLDRAIGPVDYGTAATTRYADLVADWYDYHFKQRETELGTGDQVQLFLLNANEWHGYASWPPPATRETPFYLRGEGHANTIAGDGKLLRDRPAKEPADEFVYDPNDPVMSLMGADSQMLPVDQRPNDHRGDILVYSTPPLQEDLDLIGPVRLELWAASNRTDTDFVAKLVEVRPDGMCINITSGIMRTRYRSGYESPNLMEQGEPYLFSIRMLPVGIRLTRGSRLRLDITSSDFPAFDRNHNTGTDFWSDGEFEIARQTVFHDELRPSHLVLPVQERL